MNILRKTATTLGGIFLAALLIAALAPKATRGVAAALVQVTNTSANPVPVSAADSPANFPFATFLCIESPGEGCQPFSTFLVPTTTSTGLPVKRLVIENVSGTCEITPGVTGFVLSLSAPSVGATTALPFPFPLLAASPNNSAGQFVVGGSAVRIYTDPGDTVSISAQSDVPAGNFEFCSLIVEGHLEAK